ncbi:MAG TPA: DUF2231 domain-containing protein [Chthoniobacteraceae bacterium]|jgi:uncharacterized membrane protein
MKSKARFLGHPIHPMLIVLPLGLLPAALVCDAVHFATKRGFWGEMAFWLIAGGIVGGAIAGVAGFIDWLAIPRETRAKRIGALHGLINVGVLLVFSVSWWLRRSDPTALQLLPVILGVGALILSGISAWLGGELIYKLGIGVHATAQPNAESSLSDDSP